MGPRGNLRALAGKVNVTNLFSEVGIERKYNS